VVTVLFVDLVGSTAQADRRDPEDIRATLVPFFDGLRTDIEGYGGRVEKFIGDAVMALFGAPVAHEDDPERAVRAALDIRDTIGRLNDERGFDLNVRVSVVTGEALIDLRALDEGHGMAAGDIVNIGFRLAEAAPVDGILVDESTYRATQQVIEFRESDPVRARGKAMPLLVWQVIGSRGGYGDVDLLRPRLPFFGRREHLLALNAGLACAQEAQRAQLINVIGVAGIGKSRLVLEFASELHARSDLLLYWRQGRSLPYGEETPFWALAEILRAHTGILRTDDPKTAEDKLRRALRHALPDETEADWVASRMRALVGLSGDGEDHSRLESFAAWRRFFEGLASHGPVIVVFEDVQWADEGLLEFIDHLAVWASGVALLVICTARPAIFERHPAWGSAHANSTLVSLSPLSDEETSAIVTALLGEGVPEAVERELLGHAEGNPLYAGEYARMLVDRGFLRRDGDGWQLERRQQLPLPESVQAIIAARLDALPPEEKRLLQAAASVGRVFWLGAIATLSGLPHYVVSERLERLEQKGFLRRDHASTVGGEAQYSFHHVLVRDIAYGQVPRGTRADDHCRAAEWLAALKSDRADLAELIAHHYQSALAFANAAGSETSELDRRTRLALRDAGDRAAALHAWPTAKRLYGEALATWPAEDADHPLVAYHYGKAWFRAEGGGADVLEAAVPELLERGYVEFAAEALVALGDLCYREGDRDGAFARFDEALALVEKGAPSSTKAYVLSTLARFHSIELRSDEAIRIGTGALAMADQLGLDEVRAHALNNIGFARISVGDKGGIGDLERSLRLALDRNSPESIRSCLNLGTAHAHFGNLEETFHVHAEGRHAAERFGDAAGMQWFAAERLWELYWRGGWDEAIEVADALLAEVDAGAPRSHSEPAARLARGWITLARDRVDAAVDEATRLWAFVREARYLQMAFPALALRARALAAAGRDEEAWADVDELLRLWRENGIGGSYWTADLAFAAAELDRGGEIVPHLAEARRTPWVEAAVAVATGDFPRAADLFAAIGSRPDEALARLRAGASLLDEVNAPQAREELERALDFFRSVGAARYVLEGERLIAVTR
jgi:class 3 adenylate cyclase/tetratricopeptide (TPR) repeat protein